jgi:putative acetyltransferase
MKSYSMLGPVTLGSQLRVFSEWITSDAAAVYDHFDVAIDPKWFPVFYVLASEKDSTVTSVASTIGHSHVSVSKIISEMETANLTVSKKCRSDSRCTLVNLSRTGIKLVPKLVSQCERVDRALSQLTEETGIDFWEALAVTRRSLKYFPLSERIEALDQQNDLRIIDFTPKYSEDFKRLNVEWITRFWQLEDEDEKALDNPTEYIINKGGAVLIALYEGNPVGSVALIPHDDTILELAKMAVSTSVQGKGVGLALGESALERARLMGARRVYLESNTKLSPALSLYRKLGFIEINDSKEASPYERCNVRMEKFLGSHHG